VGCANIVPPSGGPRDSLPPYLVIAKPKDSAVNVFPKEIFIGFNEFITTTALQENVIVSPALKNIPLIDANLRTIRIRITDTLAANTTYSIQFGNAIKDVNEGNVIPNFTYAFSTGAHLDTGRLVGSVHLAETGRTDSTLIVVLHPTGKDSAIYKNKPLYYAKVNSKGRFQFQFLPYRNFQIFVVPNDYTKKYDDSTKVFAFADSAVSIKASNDSIALYAFQAFKKVEKKKTVSANNKNVKRNSALLKYGKNLDGSEQDLLNPMVLSFETPIQFNDSFPITLCDTNNKKLDGYTVSLDTASKQAILIQYPWQENTKFHLIVPKKAVTDSLHNFLIKADTVAFVTKSAASYGAVQMRISGYQAFIKPVLLLTKEDKVLFSYPITKNLLNIAMLPPGEYVLKVLEDRNSNGIWDTGSYGKQKIQPERITVLKPNLIIKANWENELDLIINK
jgi:hypothetical protein